MRQFQGSYHISLFSILQYLNHNKLLIICIGFLVVQKNSKVVSIDSFEDVPVNDESALLKAAANQPITVAIEASSRDFQFYTSVIPFFFNHSL